jgi:hypothetical protein
VDVLFFVKFSTKIQTYPQKYRGLSTEVQVLAKKLYLGTAGIILKKKEVKMKFAYLITIIV